MQRTEETMCYNRYNRVISKLMMEPGSSRDTQQKKRKNNENRPLLQLLNEEQHCAHDIIECHLKAFLAGKKPKPLHMLVQGQGGTGKTGPDQRYLRDISSL